MQEFIIDAQVCYFQMQAPLNSFVYEQYWKQQYSPSLSIIVSTGLNLLLHNAVVVIMAQKTLSKIYSSNMED